MDPIKLSFLWYLFSISQQFLKTNTEVHHRSATVPHSCHVRPATYSVAATTWIYTSPVSHPAVTKTTAHSDPRRLHNSNTTNQPSDPLVETCTLDSIVMVPFFRVPDRRTQGSHRYVNASRYLGLYQISERGF